MLHIQVYDLKSGLKFLKKTTTKWCTKVKVTISTHVVREMTAGWGREGHGKNHGQKTGIHVGNWEVSDRKSVV